MMPFFDNSILLLKKKNYQKRSHFPTNSKIMI